MKFTVEVFRRSSNRMEHRGEKFFIKQYLSSVKRDINYLRNSTPLNSMPFRTSLSSAKFQTFGD